MTSSSDGPFLVAALLCERVLEEKDGVKSAIRIIDRVIHAVATPELQREMAPFRFPLALLISLKAGAARGSFELGIRLVKPSGEASARTNQTVYFEGDEDRGVDVVANTVVEFEYAGIYWFEIYFDNKLITKIPLRIVYLPQQIRRTWVVEVFQYLRPNGVIGTSGKQDPKRIRIGETIFALEIFS